jgi:aspartate racemase
MKKLGIIGGLGPMATAHFITLLTRMTEAAKDQEHIELILYSRPGIPDRTDFITGLSTLSPEADLVSLARELSNAGAEILAIPCFTAFYFYDAISRAAGIPVIHPVLETVASLKAAGIRTAGILATDGMLQSGIFQDELKKAGIAHYLPEAEEQNAIMHLIYEIKSGRPADVADFLSIAKRLFDSGAEVILLGCSELSILKRDHKLTTGYLDVLEILAQSAVRQCGKLRDEYTNLLPLP